ncbi:MAG: STAS domain-containing protein [Verrucomicrobia bacterium]|nr:STAS domain-containing protein [Verrucomicrobiota bacterium]
MKLNISFRPKLLDALKGYTQRDFFRDLVAGITVGIVALPLAMALGIATGVKPEQGIFTAVVAGFLISALGGSRVCIGGPTAAFIVILNGILLKYGAANLVLCTMMAGMMLVAMGAARLGALIKFVPFPLTMGFTSGIAVTIFSTQIKDFLGLEVEKVPSEFVHKLVVLGEHLNTIHWPTVALAVASLVVIFGWPKRLAKWVPGTVVALVATTAFVMLTDADTRWGLQTIGTKFGGIPQALPKPSLPHVDWTQIQSLLQPALTIALLAAIESLLCAVVADGMIDDRHDSNQELMAQGIANIVSPIFGGVAATGAIVRTATNIKTGGRSPVAGIVHACTLLAILLVLAPLAKFIPLAALSAVLVVVAYNMGEWHFFAQLHRWPKSDAAVFLTSFALTTLLDLTVAVELGLLLAAIFFIKRMADTTQVSSHEDATETEDAYITLAGLDIPPGVMVFRVFGVFFFGAVDKLETALQRAGGLPDVLILRMRAVQAIDATGINALEDILEKLRKRNKHLILVGAHAQPLFAMERAGFIDRLGLENLCGNLDESLTRSREMLGIKEPAKPVAPAPAAERETTNQK